MKTRLFFLHCLALAVAFATLLSPVPTARAAVEFTTFDADDAYNDDQGPVVDGSAAIFGYQAYADEFTASFTGMLSSVDVAIEVAPGLGGDGKVIVELYPNDPTTNLPLTSGEITLGNVSAAGGVATLTPSSTTISLVSGVVYWLALAPADTKTTTVWFSADNKNATPVANSTNGGASYSISSESGAEAFDINATLALAPEPSTWALLGLGVGLLGLTLRRRAARV